MTDPTGIYGGRIVCKLVKMIHPLLLGDVFVWHQVDMIPRKSFEDKTEDEVLENWVYRKGFDGESYMLAKPVSTVARMDIEPNRKVTLLEKK